MRRGCRKTPRTAPRGRTQCGWRTAVCCQPERRRAGWRKPALPDACLGARSRRPERVVYF